MEHRGWSVPDPSEQTLTQKVLADRVVEEIKATGTSVTYDPQILRHNQLCLKYLLQSAIGEELLEMEASTAWFEHTFGRYGMDRIFDAYDRHPSRRAHARALAEEVGRVWDTLPPMCRLPRNKPTSSSK